MKAMWTACTYSCEVYEEATVQSQQKLHKY